MTTRQKDYIIECNVAKFMDEYLWKKIAQKKNIQFERVTDKQRQYRGQDVVIGNVIVDEKAKVKNCMNEILMYPSFELQHICSTGKIVDGWFMKQTDTHLYAYIAVFSSAKTEYDISFDNIDHLNVMLVKKSEVKDFIHKYDTEENLKNAIDQLRDQQYENKYRFVHNMYWLKKSTQFDEQPINLVLKRETLESLKNTKTLDVYKDKIQKA